MSEQDGPTPELGLSGVGGGSATATALLPYYQDDVVTLYYGNCLDLLPAILGDVPALRFGSVVTDPPYGIGWKKGLNKAAGSRAHDGIQGDVDTTARDRMLALTATLPALVFGSLYAPYPPDRKHILIWEKPVDAGVVGSTTGYRRDVEPVFMCGPWPVRPVESGSVLRAGANSISHTAAQTGHPHTKPVPLMRDLLRRVPPGAVLDPFAGSGSTLRAAKDLGIPAVGIEIEERYCRLIAGRLAQDVLDLGGAAA